MTATPFNLFIFRSALLAAGALGLSMAPAVLAQPSSNSANQFGDRQVGQWGDPSQGYFGNPAVGNFDSSAVREPPAGTRALGRVQNGRNAPISPYISLPNPSDAAPETPAKTAPAPASKPVNSSKKPVAKKKTG